MNDQFRTFLVARGMPEDTDDAQALEWADKNLTRGEQDKPDPAKPAATETPPTETQRTQSDPAEVARQAIADERSRVDEITNAVEAAGLERSIADDLVKRGVAIGEARKQIIAKLRERGSKPIGGAVDPKVTGEGIERFRSAARDGLIVRCHANAQLKRDPFSTEKPAAAGHEEFARIGVKTLARKCLEFLPLQRSPWMMPDREVFDLVMGKRTALQRSGVLERASDGMAYHVTGMFANLLIDAYNKSLLSAYDEAPVTYPTWTRTAASVPDFKNINRIRVGEFGVPELVPENKPYPDVKTSDNKELSLIHI